MGEWSLGDVPWTLLTVVFINEYPGLLVPSNWFCSGSWRDFGFPGHPMDRGCEDSSHVFCSCEVAAVGGAGETLGLSISDSSFTHKLIMAITDFPFLVSWRCSTSKIFPVSSSWCPGSDIYITFIFFLQPGVCLQDPLQKPQALTSRGGTGRSPPYPTCDRHLCPCPLCWRV